MADEMSGAQRMGMRRESIKLAGGAPDDAVEARRASKRSCEMDWAESKEANDPGSWELSLESVKPRWVWSGQAKPGAAPTALPSTGAGDTDVSSKMKVQNIRNEVFTWDGGVLLTQRPQEPSAKPWWPREGRDLCMPGSQRSLPCSLRGLLWVRGGCGSDAWTLRLQVCKPKPQLHNTSTGNFIHTF